MVRHITDFKALGTHAKQLRRLRKAYMERRDTLIECLGEHFGEWELLGTASGTHLIWRLPDHMPGATECQKRARAVGVVINTMYLETVTGPEFLEDWDRFLLLGYADLKPEIIREAVVRMAEMMG